MHNITFNLGMLRMWLPPKLLLIMRLIIIILTTCLMQVSAATFAQKLTYAKNGASLEEVFKEIRKQTGYNVFYSNKKIDDTRKIDVHFKDADLKDVLEVCVDRQSLEYTIDDKNIFIKPKDPTFLERVVATLAYIDIRGRVTDENGNALPGAIVKVKGTNRSTSTNDKGEFFLGNVNEKAVLIIAYMGYETREISAAKDLGIVSLKLANNALEEVNVTVNTGYQTLPKERATGSFDIIDNKKLNLQVGTNILDRLPAIANGLTMDRRTNKPGLLVRGLSTIQGPRGPLIVVDNFPYEGDINNINPNEVENITILKDAAAASIWGTKAGNGVIVITTKKGSFNKRLTIELNSNVTIGNKPDLSYIKQISSSDFIDVEQFLFNKKFKFSDTISIMKPPFSPVYELLFAQQKGLISSAETQRQLDLLRQVDIRDEYAKYFYQKSINQQYSANISAGSQNSFWNLFTGYDDSKDNLNTIYRKINIKLGNTFHPFKNLQISTGLHFTNSNAIAGRPGYGQLRTNNGELPVYTKFADENGNAVSVIKDFRLSFIESFGGGKLLDWKYYPLTDDQNTKNVTQIQDILGNLNLAYKIQDFSVNVNYQYERQQNSGSILNNEQSYFTRSLINKYSQIDPVTKQVKYIIPRGSIYDLSNVAMTSNFIRGQLNYDHQWADHSVTAFIGSEIRESKTQGYTKTTYGYNDDTLTFSNVDFTTAYPSIINGNMDFIPDNAGFLGLNNRFVSTYANAAYTFKNRYTASVSGRRDASNLFGVNSNDRWNPLYSGGLSWNITNEQFFKVSWISFLKLRGTYGISGNVDQSRSAVTTFSYQSNSPYTLAPYALVNTYANPDLRWEKVGTLNFGLDFRIVNDRFSGSIEYYRKNASDLYGLSVIDYTGGAGGGIIKNSASMLGKGLDVKLSSINTRGRLIWATDLIFNYATDKIMRYDLPQQPGSVYVGQFSPRISSLVGKPVYSVFSYKWAGLDPNTGDPQGYLNGNISKDYVALTSSKVAVADLKYHGPALPVYTGSLGNSLTWNNFSLTARLVYKLGYYFTKEPISYSSLFNGRAGHSDFANRWQKPGDEKKTNIPSMVYPSNVSRDAFYSGSDVLIDKGDHVRLEYINLSYALAKDRMPNLPLNGIQFYLNVNNVGILWRANKDGIDPDYPINTLPSSRSFTIGLKANL